MTATMKHRHATALAFVVWYLMLPPKLDNGPSNKQWNILQSFDTAKECERAAGKLRAQLESGLTPMPLDEARPLFAQCIKSDDPRLAK